MHCTLKAALKALVKALAGADPLAAGPYKDSVRAAERGDYSTAVKPWRPVAEAGNSVAQYSLRVMYANGQGVPQDYSLALPVLA